MDNYINLLDKEPTHRTG